MGLIIIFGSKFDIQNKKMNLLSLGDSYTIGEQVRESENFPHQLIELLNEKGYKFNKPQIVAKTGWTTDELQAAIDNEGIKETFDFVTLLVGVNNQYRGRMVSEYMPEFDSLVQQSINFANGDQQRVIVLSIPDWGITPFAALPTDAGEMRDRQKISFEIDAYNNANKSIAAKYGVHYLEITTSTRLAENDPTLLAADGLHPSSKEYKKWAEMISEIIIKELSKIQ
jgi:lysophospholipase L1-like esterase